MHLLTRAFVLKVDAAPLPAFEAKAAGKAWFYPKAKPKTKVKPMAAKPLPQVIVDGIGCHARDYLNKLRRHVGRAKQAANQKGSKRVILEGALTPTLA